jgi:hypothetical protein
METKAANATGFEKPFEEFVKFEEFMGLTPRTPGTVRTP